MMIDFLYLFGILLGALVVSMSTDHWLSRRRASKRCQRGIREDSGLPVLIDVIQKHPCWTDSLAEVGNGWYAARPLMTRSCWKTRLYHAWLVLRGRAGAFQYAEDRVQYHSGKGVS